MLSQLCISNYTVVSALEIDFATGMTVITGETGAGKSIMLDALGLCLGDRADPAAVRSGCDRAEISALFLLGALPAARHWLAERDLLAGDDCLLRRIVTAEGRSRAYINGSPATLQDCAELGALLIDIHSQHAHQSLLRRPVQRTLLDAFADQLPLARDVEQLASDWLRRHRELELLTGARDEHTAHAQLLAYQVEELDALALGEDELAALEQEEKLLANAEDILRSAQQALELCEEHASGLRHAQRLLDGGIHGTRAASEASNLLDSSAIQLDEACSALRQHIDSVTVDPERLSAVQTRLGAVYEIARKHRVLPEQLAARHRELGAELAGLAVGTEHIDQIGRELAELASAYQSAAARLSRLRSRAATKLAAQVGEVLGTLAMAQCRLEVSLTPHGRGEPHPQGAEDVELLVSTNPGMPPRPLGKIASGGELSRISLAIQVVTASAGTVPSMVFDEVDAGIGGAVAEVVGRLLRALAADAQVLCVTHLPQVAAQGQQHLRVSKTQRGKQVETQLEALQADDKVQEIARMLGGVKITSQTLAHAREMLADGVAGQDA